SEFTKYNTESLIWTTLKSNEALEKQVVLLKDKIHEDTLIATDLFNRLNSLSDISFEQSFKQLKDIVSEDVLNKYIINTNNNKKNIDTLNIQARHLKDFLELTKANFRYDEEKVKDPYNLYDSYFDSQKLQFESINKLDLVNKKKYIEFIYSHKHTDLVNKLKGRKQKLSDIISIISNV